MNFTLQRHQFANVSLLVVGSCRHGWRIDIVEAVHGHDLHLELFDVHVGIFRPVLSREVIRVGHEAFVFMRVFGLHSMLIEYIYNKWHRFSGLLQLR